MATAAMLKFAEHAFGADYLNPHGSSSDEDSLSSSLTLSRTSSSSSSLAAKTTRWNPAVPIGAIPRRQLPMDSNLIVPFSATLKTEKLMYRRWKARVARSCESRTICWMGVAPPLPNGKNSKDKKCYACKLELETDPSHLKSFPYAVWVKAMEKGCPYCGFVVQGVGLLEAKFGLEKEKCQLAVVGKDEGFYWGTKKSDEDGYTVAVFWVGEDGDCSEHFQVRMRRKKKVSWSDVGHDGGYSGLLSHLFGETKSEKVDADEDITQLELPVGSKMGDETGSTSNILNDSHPNGEKKAANTESGGSKTKEESYQPGCRGSPVRDPFELARNLLDKCNREHSCQRTTSDFLPTRLLEIQHVSGGHRTRIVQSAALNDRPIEYTALSYCWGKRLPLRLLKDTMEKMETEIPWNNLPPLFQEAISFTLSIRVKYLWIDALCIVQNDRSDWEQEAAQMGSIYHHSYVTIGATSSRNSTDPLSMPTFKNIALSLDRPGGTGLQEVFESVEVSTIGGDLTWPLHHRGWAYQEILLPSRYLDFDSNGLLLHCCEGTTRASSLECQSSTTDSLNSRPADEQEENDDYINSEYSRTWLYHNSLANSFRQPWTFRWFWTRLLSTSSTSSTSLSQSLLSPSLSDIKGTAIPTWKIWREVVTMYTNRRLTYSSDRLPALGDLAAEYLRRSPPGEEYMAGLWKSSFLELVTWGVAFRDAEDEDEQNTKLKGDEVENGEQEDLDGQYQGPSWSWASVNGIIDYNQRSFDTIKTHYSRLKFSSIHLNGTNPFGRVKSGSFVILEGWLSWASLEVNEWRNKYSTTAPKYKLSGLGGFRFDEDFEPDVGVENVDVVLESEQGGGALRSARRVQRYGMRGMSGKDGELQVCTVLLVHLYGYHFGNNRVYLVLGIVGTDEGTGEFLFQRLGVVEGYWFREKEVEEDVRKGLEDRKMPRGVEWDKVKII